MSLAGLRVLSLESRRAAEIETLIRKQGGEPFVAPSVEERPLSDHTDALRLAQTLENGSIELLILMTGVGLTFWRDAVGAERADAALQKAKLLVRGSKPAVALRAAGLSPNVTVPEPNTWREIVDVIAARPERRIGIQEYGRKNARLTEELERLGAQVESFALYRWELPANTGPLREAVHRLAARTVDVVLFTSGVQLDHLFAIAAEERLSDQVERALREHVVVASIGPIMNEALIERGIQPDIVPESPKMGPLVYAAAAQAASVAAAKNPSR